MAKLDPETTHLGGWCKWKVSSLELRLRPAERAFNCMIRKAKANALWLVHRVWTGLGPFGRQNQATKPNGRW
jgi:hypothetical protein